MSKEKLATYIDTTLPVALLSQAGASKKIPKNRGDTITFRRRLPYSTNDGSQLACALEEAAKKP